MQRVDYRFAILIAGCFWGLSAPATGLADRAEPSAKPWQPVEYATQGLKSPVYDIRWATDSSVFLATSLDQVAEHRLEAGLPTVRQLYPPTASLSFGMVYANLGVSGETLTVAQRAKRISWRPVAPHPHGSVLYEWRTLGHIDDLDLQGDRLAWIGWPDSVNQGFLEERSGVAWVDRLEKHLESPQRLLSEPSTANPGQPLSSCLGLGIGALRFQADGALLLAPGFLPEIVLLDPAGRELRRWDTRWFGVDTAEACQRITPELRQRLHLEPRAVEEWVNKHQIVDEVLATPKGPALIVRRWEGGLPAWRLYVLGAAQVESFDLPVRAVSPFDRLAADVRGNRLALLVGDFTSFPRRSEVADRVFVVKLTPPWLAGPQNSPNRSSPLASTILLEQ